MAQYRSFVLLFLSLFFFSLMIVLMINYYEDPGSQFHSSQLLEQKMTNLMLNKRNVAVTLNVNERLLQKLMLTQIKDRPDVLVLGSSRSMAINHNLFKGMSFYNASVSGAVLEDDIALYYLYQQHGWRPKIIVIGLDPWVLNKNNNQAQWKSLLVEYNKGIQLFSHQNTLGYGTQIGWIADKYLQLLSWEYLIKSIGNIFSHKHILLPYESNKYDNKTYNLRLFDGTLVRSKDMELTPANVADSEGVHFAEQVPIYSLGKYTELDAIHMTMFENFINYLLNNHIQVIFYLPPFEPKAYEGIQNKKYEMVNRSENYFLGFAEQHHIKVIGSYNPAKINVNANDFFDGMHMKLSGLNKNFGMANNSLYHDIHIDYWAS